MLLAKKSAKTVAVPPNLVDILKHAGFSSSLVSPIFLTRPQRILTESCNLTVTGKRTRCLKKGSALSL